MRSKTIAVFAALGSLCGQAVNQVTGWIVNRSVSGGNRSRRLLADTNYCRSRSACQLERTRSDDDCKENVNNITSDSTDDSAKLAWQKEIDELRVALEISSDQGIQCTGEPSVDPSRAINPNQGDSEWMDDW
jgi:hypothetical protein